MNKLRNLLEDISAALLVFLLFAVFVLGVIVGMFDKVWIFLIVGLILVVVITMFFTFKKSAKKEEKELEKFEKEHEQK